ncbi:hypothetical protein [Janibacter sp. G1551]|uniref:hypothetical protein n=1 Tax=Janibacter sp. G1551 TaxID=3420440 RepID=UPI003D01B9BE
MSDLDVVGGAFGTSAVLTELLTAAAELGAVADEILELAWRVQRAPSVADLDRDAVWAPASYLVVQARLASLAIGLHAAATGLAEVAVAVRASVAGYASADEAVAFAVAGLQDAFGLGVGLGIGAAPLPVGVIGALGADRADALAYDHPWLVDAGAGGVEGVLLGLLLTQPWSIPVAAVAGHHAGVSSPLGSEEDALATIAVAAGGIGVLRDGADVRARPAGTRTIPAPRTVGSLVGLDSDPEAGGRGRVRVVQVPRPGGGNAWIVDVPGTRAWSPVAGEDPSDLTTNVWLMAGRETATMRAVEDALTAAKVAGGGTDADPVLLAGHSQGGITAAALAASPTFRSRHRVTHVATTGAPVARFAVPASVQVLAMEHDRDPVPRLDGRPNPDRATWVTVRRDPAADVDGAAGTGRRSAAAHHERALYARTADLVDASTDPSLRAWRDSAAPFLGDDDRLRLDGEREPTDVVVREYTLHRR